MENVWKEEAVVKVCGGLKILGTPFYSSTRYVSFSCRYKMKSAIIEFSSSWTLNGKWIYQRDCNSDDLKRSTNCSRVKRITGLAHNQQAFSQFVSSFFNKKWDSRDWNFGSKLREAAKILSCCLRPWQNFILSRNASGMICSGWKKQVINKMVKISILRELIPNCTFCTFHIFLSLFFLM